MIIEQDIHWLENVPPDQMRGIVDAVYRVHHFFAVITDLDSLLEAVMAEGKAIARAEACSLMLYDAAGEDLYFHITKGESGDQQALKGVRLRLNQGIAGVAAATRQSINVESAENDSRFFREADAVSHFKTQALLAVPMLDRDALIGVLEVVNKAGGGAFTNADMRVMEMFATLAASAISNARLIEENVRSARMAAIGQAVTGLCHHIKNIVTGMVGATQLIDQGLESSDMDIVNRCWAIHKRSTNRIADFVQDMLAFSKPRKPMYEPCYVPSLIAEVIQTFWGSFSHKKFEIKVEAEEARKRVFIDTQGIFRCLLNLIQNAADAVPPVDGHILVTARVAGDALIIEVADNGPGVPESIRHQIFEPFFSTKGSQGTGLGLAVTYKTIKEHNGEIAVESRPDPSRTQGSGAVFRITLPGACKEHLNGKTERDNEKTVRL